MENFEVILVILKNVIQVFDVSLSRESVYHLAYDMEMKDSSSLLLSQTLLDSQEVPPNDLALTFKHPQILPHLQDLKISHYD